MDFKRVKEPSRDGKFNFFGGASLGNGVKLGIYPGLRLTSAEGRRKVAEKFGRATRIQSGDGKVTWEYFFTHPDFPLVYFTLYDWKGGLSCGLGIHQDLYRTMTPAYAEKINEKLTDLVNYTYHYGG